VPAGRATRIIAVAGDAGGASALVPVLLRLAERRDVELTPWAYGHAASVWQSRGIAFASLPANGSLGEAARQLGAADLLLTATSANELDYERHLTAEARRRGVPSLAVLDYWSNYARRFGGADEWPDRVAVMDERARDGLAAAGLDAERLVVTGQPALDEVCAWRSGSRERVRDRLRDEAGVGPRERLVLYASSPVGVALTPGEPAADVGYDTFTVLTLLIESLDLLSRQESSPITLVVRPHPREEARSFRGLAGDAVRVTVNGEGHGRDWILASDLVTGMTSMLLVEACHLGRLTVSLQPGTRVPDPVPTNVSGASLPVYTAAEALPTLRRVLFDSPERADLERRLARLAQRPAATAAVLAIIEEMTSR
jgi:hypothetical protein